MYLALLHVVGMLTAANERTNFVEGTTPVRKQGAGWFRCRRRDIKLGPHVRCEARFECIEVIDRPGLNLFENSRQLWQSHEHSRYIAAVRTISAARDLSELRHREEVFHPILCGLRDIHRDLPKGDRFPAHALERQRMGCRARFVRNGKTQAVCVHRSVSRVGPYHFSREDIR